MDWVRAIADYLVIPTVLVAGVALLLVPKGQRYPVWAKALVAGLVALLFAKIASLFYQGERPFETLGLLPGAAFLPNPGFPSDHSLLVFTATFTVWAATKRAALFVLLFMASVLVSVGRVLALVHTPLDVLGGFACALLACVAVYGQQFFTKARQNLVK